MTWCGIEQIDTTIAEQFVSWSQTSDSWVHIIWMCMWLKKADPDSIQERIVSKNGINMNHFWIYLKVVQIVKNSMVKKLVWVCCFNGCSI